MSHRFRTLKPRNTTAAGYGHNHQQARREAAQRHQPTDLCTRCKQPLGPMGPWLHYDHTDDRSGYAGFAHGACNRRAGARVGNQRQRRIVAVRRAQSRNWGGEIPRKSGHI